MIILQIKYINYKEWQIPHSHGYSNFIQVKNKEPYKIYVVRKILDLIIL